MKVRYKYWIMIGALTFSACQPSEQKQMEEKRAKLEQLKREVAKLEDELKAGGYDAEKSALENAKVVTVLQPVRTDFRTFLEAPGKVTSKTNIMVSAEMSGTLMSLNVREGSSVSRGQVIGQVDKSLLESNIQELETSMILAEQSYERQKNLWDQKIGTEFQFLQAKNNYESLQKRLETLKKQRDKAYIVAPISGEVDKVFHNPGEMVSPGVPVVQVVNLGTIQVEAEIAESYLPKVRRGDRVSIEFPSISATRETQISAISQVINAANRTFKIQAILNNPGGEIKPNMLAIVKLTEHTGKNMIIIPTKLIQEDMDGQYVNVIAANNMVERRYVTVGNSSRGQSEILSGLEGDEQVINLGFRLVSHGDRVRIKS